MNKLNDYLLTSNSKIWQFAQFLKVTALQL